MQISTLRSDAMNDSQMTPRPKREKRRSYFHMIVGTGGGPGASIELDNPDEVIKPPMTTLSPNPDRATRGYKGCYSVPPRFVFGRKKGPMPRDIEEYAGHWLVSDRMKAALEQVDPEGFDFAACDIRLKNGEPGPRYWLCDVMRVLDAVDEANSTVQLCNRPSEPKLYGLAGPHSLNFRTDVVGSAHAFRLKFFMPYVVVDDLVKATCKEAGIRGTRFVDVRHG